MPSLVTRSSIVSATLTTGVAGGGAFNVTYAQAVTPTPTAAASFAAYREDNTPSPAIRPALRTSGAGSGVLEQRRIPPRPGVSAPSTASRGNSMSSSIPPTPGALQFVELAHEPCQLLVGGHEILALPRRSTQRAMNSSLDSVLPSASAIHSSSS
ncbi:MAG: hypothetical protein ACR2QA_12015 [Solirubrobacteraceae bacterium]